jgi:hypothetical protein
VKEVEGGEGAGGRRGERRWGGEREESGVGEGGARDGEGEERRKEQGWGKGYREMRRRGRDTFSPRKWILHLFFFCSYSLVGLLALEYVTTIFPSRSHLGGLPISSNLPLYLLVSWVSVALYDPLTINSYHGDNSPA